MGVMEAALLFIARGDRLVERGMGRTDACVTMLVFASFFFSFWCIIHS
jgi:hypothetical protein